jgi:hypothetical protein
VFSAGRASHAASGSGGAMRGRNKLPDCLQASMAMVFQRAIREVARAASSRDSQRSENNGKISAAPISTATRTMSSMRAPLGRA